MPLDKNIHTGKLQFSFSNLLAIIIVLLCFAYFFWISYPSKQSENRDIGEVKTAMISILTLVIGYYFGSTKGAAAKDVKIEELQEKAATSHTDTINTENISGPVTTEKINNG